MPLTNHAKLSGANTAGPTVQALTDWIAAQSIPSTAILFVAPLAVPGIGKPEYREDGWVITARW
jgi:hypothetical protein